MKKIILPENIEVLITSFGGVGTTFLISHISKYKKTNHWNDEDGFKHIPLPPINFNKNIKFVYIYGSPQHAAISLFRRGFQRSQSKKLQKWIKTNPSPISKNMTIEDYASNGIDSLYLKEHFYNWHNKYSTIGSVMFLRYETIFDHIPDLMNFLELPEESIFNFPEKKERVLVKNNISSKTLKQIDKIYQEFDNDLKKLGAIKIKQGVNKKYLLFSYLKPPYPRALAQQILKQLKTNLKQFIRSV